MSLSVPNFDTVSRQVVNIQQAICELEHRLLEQELRAQQAIIEENPKSSEISRD